MCQTRPSPESWLRSELARDRHYGDAEMLGREFLAIDTGGFEPETRDGMLQAMRRQAELAIEEAHAIIVLFDGNEGLLPADEEITRLLDRSDRPVFFAVNKIDGPKHEPRVAEFWELGVAELHPISALHGEGVYDLMEAVLEELPEPQQEEPEGGSHRLTRVAIFSMSSVLRLSCAGASPTCGYPASSGLSCSQL